ncbi:unnamed protein product [Ambrosiozyma monospora]|uniref:Unnamed protein product n=1 Tax=Ambrosiozyma monospora TaxID=43982 RepID=A0ACB5SZJ2_AMBMO|nr:unnamed protein product [Ambrosiozyma monospora]
MAIVFSSYVKEVIKVPKEIQFVIIKWVIHDYFANLGFDWYRHIQQPLYPRPVYFAIPLQYLTTLMDIDTILDNILAETIRDLTFDDSIFQSKQLNKFVDFVLAKSIKIHLQAPFSIKLDKVGMILLNHCCCEYTSTVSNKYLKDLYYNHLQFITFLGCDVALLGHLFEVTEELKLLVRLKCLKISGIFNPEMDLLNQELVQKLIAWRCHCDCDCDDVCHCKGECECAGHIKKRVVLSFGLGYLGNDSASMFVSRLIDLNRNGDFEIEYHHLIGASELLGSHLLSDSYNRDITLFNSLDSKNPLDNHDDDITLFKLLDLKNPLDNHGLDDLAQISKHTDRIMTLIEHDTPDDINKPFFIATKNSSDFTYMGIKYVKSEFSFKHVKSLKEVTLLNCTISYECLNSLPNTLVSLTMDEVHFEDTEFHKIRLPVHLMRLKVSEDFDNEILSDIVNEDQLEELSTTFIDLSVGNYGKSDIHLKRSKHLFVQLKQFLHELPSLKYLHLTFLRINMNLMVDYLALNSLDSLVGFAVDLNVMIDDYDTEFPLSCLPPTCDLLKLDGFTSLSGKFSKDLNTLKIGLKGYPKSFEYFWDQFITPLNNLYCLKIDINESSTQAIDFSYLQFPDHLHTLVLHFKAGCTLIFNELPPSMEYVFLECTAMMPSHETNSVVFQNIDVETIKNKFGVRTKPLHLSINMDAPSRP